MIVLGIETSCDETSAAIIEGTTPDQPVLLKANSVASSLALHATTGGVIPEVAAREQIKYMLPVLQEALHTGLGGKSLSPAPPPIDAIAITYGPGLIGSLLIGVETAKTLSYLWHKPLIPVNHMVGHIYANWIEARSREHSAKSTNHFAHSAFPVLALVVSGGHTDLLLIKKHGDITLLGGTRDDAAGEAFDKIGRLLQMPYPAGPIIEQRAKLGNPKRFHFPRPLHDSGDFDFSFSGLKTAVLREVQKIPELTEETVNDLAAGVQQAIIDILVKKTVAAARAFHAATIVLSGGVAANQTLTEAFKEKIAQEKLPLSFHVPPRNLCTDNAAMIASAAFYNYHEVSWNALRANPELYFE